MKSTITESAPVRRKLNVFVVIAVVVLAIGVAAYASLAEQTRLMERYQRDAAVLDKLTEVTRYNTLLRSLNTGHTEDAKQFLKLALADDLAGMGSLTTAISPSASLQAKCAEDQLARDMKSHPDYYAIAGRKTHTASNMQVAKK